MSSLLSNNYNQEESVMIADKKYKQYKKNTKQYKERLQKEEILLRNLQLVERIARINNRKTDYP